jgi:hypothetical protein
MKRFARLSLLIARGWRGPIGCALAVAVVLLASCGSVPEDSVPPQSAEVSISSLPPDDIEGGALNADLAQASRFAWAQLIAMNWSASLESGAVSRRGVPAGPAQVSDDNRRAPRVWETLRAKTEVFPGTGDPDYAGLGPGADYGFDQPPLYRYDPRKVGSYPGLEPGQVPACFSDEADRPTPWVELSESHEVGPEQMFAGAAPFDEADQEHDRQRVLYAVKVDRDFYRYVVSNGWLDGGNEGSTIPADATAAYIDKNRTSPPAGGTDLVSFPDGSLQLKTAWRRLTQTERDSGRFFTARARAYQAQDSTETYRGQPGNPEFPCYVDSEWGLVAMHLKSRTVTAPYYIWGTFEHADNILSADGKAVEDAVGRYTGDPDLSATEPPLHSRNAVSADPPTPETIQRMTPAQANADPGKRLYYRNLAGTPTTQGTIALNHRFHPIPGPVIEANEAAHAALNDFLEGPDGQRHVIPSQLLHYKLVGIQWRPADKPEPGKDVLYRADEPDETLRYPGIYYLANMMLETSYRLQNYSGIVQSHLPPPNNDLNVQDLVTDFDTNGKPLINMIYSAPVSGGEPAGINMGGCMGCHGQMQLKGYDFNFIFRRGRVDMPEMDVSIRLPLIDMVHPGEPD